MGERSPEGRPGRARSAIVALIALTAVLAVPGSAAANVMVVGTGATLELKLDSAVSNIAVSGASDESVTFTELSSSGPTFSTTAGGGTSCPGGGTRTVTCSRVGAFPALLVTDDGQVGPRDTIDASSAPVLISTGGAGGLLAAPISIKGSPANDFLHGSNGADELTGGEGHDEYFGQGGEDTINAYDGLSDRVNCGDGVDKATVDAADEVVNCEQVIVVVDLDGDGYRTTEDCNDSDPKIFPGAKEIPGNDIDDDCDGKDDSPAYVDADKDGYEESHDCDDKDAKIKPGALEIVGNKVDENCDGVAAPFPLLGSSIHSSFLVSGQLTTVVGMTVTDVPKDATIKLVCRTTHLRPARARRGGGGGGGSGGCDFSKSFGFARGPRQSVSLDGSFSKRKLKPGTVITVQITAPQTIGRQVQYKTRKGKEPSVSSGCLQPEGKTKPVSCGSFNQPTGVR